MWKIKQSYEKYVINLLLFLFHRQIPERENCIFAQQHSLTTFRGQIKRCHLVTDYLILHVGQRNKVHVHAVNQRISLYWSVNNNEDTKLATRFNLKLIYTRVENVRLSIHIV